MATKKKIKKNNHIYEYYQQIVDGKVTVGDWIIKIYTYIVECMESGELIFDEKKADDAIEWIEAHAFHSEGPKAPNSLKLELWQKAMLSAMFGLVDENGNRQFREVVLVVARKNGKSLLASAIAKYIWWVDGGYGTRVYCVAPKLDQADIIYNDIWQHVLLDPEWQALKMEIENSADEHNKRLKDKSGLAKHRQSDLYVEATNSTVKKIAFSAKKSDGFNPSLAICDEIAAWPGDNGLKQYEVLKSGMGARPEGMLFSCSTAGYENDGIYDELIKRATALLSGTSKEKRLLPFIYMVDDPEKWNDINELKKSNPNLGVSVTEDYLKEEIAVAEGSYSKKTEFLTKYCNVKQNSALAWFDATEIEACFSGNDLKFEDFENCYAVGGIDLSQTTDLTACTLAVEKNGTIYVFAKFFMPSEKVEYMQSFDGVPYKMYIQRGFLQESGENFVDYNDCFRWFTDLIEKYKIYPLKVGYDRFSAAYLVQQMTNYGFNMDDVYQGFNLSPIIKETEGLIKDKKIDFGNNDLLKLHLFNSALKIDAESNKVRLVKINSRQRIDGVASLLDAFTVRQKYFSEIGGQLENARR